MQLVYHFYCSNNGYSVSSQDYILSILKANPDQSLKLEYLNGNVHPGVSPDRERIFNSFYKKPIEKDYINIFQSIPSFYKKDLRAKKNIGICVFETISPPKIWIDNMTVADEIITASEFNKRVFVSNGFKKSIKVVPHAVDTNLFNSKVKPNGRYSLFTFLSIGTWKQRKNWETLIKAFYEGFEKKDNVCLLIKTDRIKELEDTIVKIKKNGEWRGKDTAPIFCERNTNMIFEDIPIFMAKGDVYINVSLGEGFGLPGIQSMALGIPIITTKFGGVLEYAKEDNCTFVEPYQSKVYSRLDGIPQYDGCIFPVYLIKEVSNKMRHVFENYNTTIKEKAMIGYSFIHKNFNYHTIGNKFLEAIQ